MVTGSNPVEVLNFSGFYTQSQKLLQKNDLFRVFFIKASDEEEYEEEEEEYQQQEVLSDYL